MGIKKLEDTITNLSELNFNLSTVILDECDTVLVATALFLLLDGGNDAPRGTAGTNKILLSN